jgi:hypothetical protein
MSVREVESVVSLLQLHAGWLRRELLLERALKIASEPLPIALTHFAGVNSVWQRNDPGCFGFRAKSDKFWAFFPLMMGLTKRVGSKGCDGQ